MSCISVSDAERTVAARRTRHTVVCILLTVDFFFYVGVCKTNSIMSKTLPKVEIAGIESCPYSKKAWDLINDSNSSVFQKLDCDANKEACKGLQGYPTFLVGGQQCGMGVPSALSLDNLKLCKKMVEGDKLGVCELKLELTTKRVDSATSELRQCGQAVTELLKAVASEKSGKPPPQKEVGAGETKEITGVMLPEKTNMVPATVQAEKRPIAKPSHPDPLTPPAVSSNPLETGELKKQAVPPPPAPVGAGVAPSDKKVHVFGKEWCKFTKDSWSAMDPTAFVKVDCDKRPDICAKHKITAYPTFMVQGADKWTKCQVGRPTSLAKQPGTLLLADMPDCQKLING